MNFSFIISTRGQTARKLPASASRAHRPQQSNAHQKNLSIRPSRTSGAKSVEKSLPVTMIGILKLGGDSIPGTWYIETRLGSSQMAISEPMTIWLLTVRCVFAKWPRPASMSLIRRHENLPRTLDRSAARRYRSRIMRPGSPARSCSSSPADMTTASTPSLRNASSVWKLLPCPLPPQMPRMSGTRVLMSKAPRSCNFILGSGR